MTNPIPWKPVVDSYASTPFMPVPFEAAVKGGNVPTDIPFVAGFTSEEGLVLFLFEKIEFSLFAKWSKLLKIVKDIVAKSYELTI